MLYVALFLAECVGLFLLSRVLNQSIFLYFYLFSRSHKMAVTLTTLLLFPGTVVHELAHLFVAEVLGVRTGKLSVFPEQLEEGHIQAGSVEIAHTDPFRRTVIGLAPIFVGVVVITVLSYYLATIFPDVLTIATQEPFKSPLFYLFLLLGYLLFAISNNMFSSKEDMKGVPPVLIFIGLLIATTYAVGVRIAPPAHVIESVVSLIHSVVVNIAIVLVLNIALLAFVRVNIAIIRRLRRIR